MTDTAAAAARAAGLKVDVVAGDGTPLTVVEGLAAHFSQTAGSEPRRQSTGELPVSAGETP
jgi:hypothetical protein